MASVKQTIPFRVSGDNAVVTQVLFPDGSRTRIYLTAQGTNWIVYRDKAGSEPLWVGNQNAPHFLLDADKDGDIVKGSIFVATNATESPSYVHGYTVREY